MPYQHKGPYPVPPPGPNEEARMTRAEFFKQVRAWKKAKARWDNPEKIRTWLGKVVYTRKKKQFTFMDMRRIIIRVYIDSHEVPIDKHPLVLKMQSLFTHWCIDLGITKEKYNLDKKAISNQFQWYLDFIKWFDTASQAASDIAKAIGENVPLLEPFTEFVQNANSLYKYVREVFPMEDNTIEGDQTDGSQN